MKQSTWIRTGYVLGTVLAVVAVVAGLLWLLGGARAVPTTTNVANVAPNAAAQSDLAEAVSAVSQAQQQAATLQNAMNTLTADARGFATTGEQWWLAEWVTEAEQNRTRENALAALEQLGLPAEEIQALRTAVEDDTKLRQADLRALRLVLEAQGVPEEQMPEPVAAYQLIPADEELGNAAKRDLAVTVVFGNDYRQAAARAQAPVESFRTKVAEMDLGDDNAAASGAAATGAAAVGSGADAVTASPARGVGGSGALLLGILGTAAGAVALIALTRLFDTRSHQVVLRYTARLRAAATLAEPGHVTPDGFVEQQELAEAINERDGAVTELLTGLDRDCALLGNLAERLHGHSSAVSASAAGTVATATGAADSAGTVSANVDTVAAGTEEMNASIQEISRSAARASSVAMEGVQAAEAAASTMTQLSESSVRIGEVMKTITAIAEQTNLLALNATIEASRAGEAGKGFGVVANEVKDLASQTGRATQDINERVVGIQGDAEAIAIALTQISEIIARINETQATIASAVEEQTATTNEMSRSVQEAAESARGIADTITTVADGARTGADAAGAAVDEVNGLTDLLARMKSAMHARTGGREFGG